MLMRLPALSRAIAALMIASYSGEAAAQSIAADANALVRQGERLARQKRYNDALVAFKSADLLHPRAQHDCWIGLAYARLKLATQANYFVSRCKARAGKRRPIPWYPKAKRLAEQMLTQDEYALVTIELVQARGKIRPEMFEADEWLPSPVRLWLPVGRYSIESKATGFGTKRSSIEIVDDSIKAVRIDLAGVKAGPATSPVRFPSLRKPKTQPKPKIAKRPELKAPAISPALTKKSEAVPPPVPKVEPSGPPPDKAPLATMNPASDRQIASASPATKGTLLPILAWSSVGLGAAILGSGAYFYGVSDEAARNADATLDKDVRNSEVARYQEYSLLTYSAYGLGGALLGTGLSMLAFDWLMGTDAPEGSIAFLPTDSGSVLSVVGHF
jgi:hypothetical protein